MPKKKSSKREKKADTIGGAIARKIESFGVNQVVSDFVKQWADDIFEQLKDVFKLKLKDAKRIIVRSFALSACFLIAVIAILAGLLTMLYGLIRYLVSFIPYHIPGLELFIFGILLLVGGYIYSRVTSKKMDEI